MVYLKFGISGAWALAIIVLYLQHGFQRVDLAFGFTDISTERKILMGLGVIALILPLALIWGQWASCRYLCWIAPLMIVGLALQRRLGTPALRLVVERDKCIACRQCERRCPMNLRLDAAANEGSLGDMDCILCGNCIDACKGHALRFGMRDPQPRQR
jgi:NAD-dependent dihydropyrimidine dehydrogenase PreA subunit